MTGSYTVVDDVKRMWPKLGTLPTTNVVIISMVALWILTGTAAVFGAGVNALFHTTLEMPQTWYEALKFYSGVTVAQFLAKRATHTDLAHALKGKNGNGTTVTAPASTAPPPTKGPLNGIT